jgi:serine/threonine protein kinase
MEEFGVALTHLLSKNLLSAVQLMIAKETVLAVRWLHRKSIVHCDLKPDNILVRDGGGGHHSVKLCDFDSATRVGDPFPSSTVAVAGSPAALALKFTRLWVSPEVYLSAQQGVVVRVTTAMDAFCVGLVLICLFSPERWVSMAELPEDDRELVSALTDASYLQRRISPLAQHYRQILLSLCSLDPSSRSLDKTLEGLQSLGATAAFTVMRNQERVIQTQRETIITIGDKVERIESKVNGIDEKVDLVLSTLRTQFASLHQSVSASFSLLSSELVRDREGLAGLVKLGEEMSARILPRLEGGGLSREEIVSLLSDVKDSINDRLNDRTGDVLSALGVLAESAKRTDLKSEDTNYLVAQLKSEVAHLTNSVGLLIESTSRIECNQRAMQASLFEILTDVHLEKKSREETRLSLMSLQELISSGLD